MKRNSSHAIRSSPSRVMNTRGTNVHATP
jgi:hypothetical protein